MASNSRQPCPGSRWANQDPRLPLPRLSAWREPMKQLADHLRDLLTFGIPGTPLTVGKLVVLAALLVLLLYLSRRFTRWMVDSFLARRHLDIGVRQAVGTLVRYAITTVGVVV